MKASKVLTMSMSVFKGQISWRFSLSKNNISPVAPDLELILFPLWHWPIMNAHTKQQQDSVWNRFYWQSKIRPPICAPFGTKSDWHLPVYINSYTVIVIFHCFGAQLEKPRWPKVFVLTQGIQSICVSAEEQSCLEGVYTVRRSEK